MCLRRSCWQDRNFCLHTCEIKGRMLWVKRLVGGETMEYGRGSGSGYIKQNRGYMKMFHGSQSLNKLILKYSFKSVGT